jgi:hypothetical protein
MNIEREFQRELRNNRYEATDEGGIFLPKAKVLLSGEYVHEQRRHSNVAHALDGGSPDDIRSAILAARMTGKRPDHRVGEVIRDHNLLVNEGLDHILNTVLNAGVQVTAWHVGIFKGNYTPVAGDTAANIATNSTEATEYDETDRVAYDEATSTAQSITNSANRATFTMNASVTIYGAFLVSLATKSGTTGTLLSAARFSASRALVATDELLVTYTVNAADNS